MKISFVSDDVGFGGGSSLKNIFLKTLPNYVDLVNPEEADLIHIYNGRRLKEYNKPTLITINGWLYSCLMGTQTNTKDSSICEKCSFLRCLNCFYHKKINSFKKIKDILKFPIHFYINQKRRKYIFNKNVVAISNCLKDVLEKNNICIKEVIYEPLDPFFLEGEKGLKKYFFYHGNLSWLAGVHLLVKSRRYNKFPFKVYGRGEYESLIKNSDLNYQTFSPDRLKIREELNNCYAFVYPSLNNPFGVSLTEAMTAGKAIIAVNRGFPTEIIKDGKNGLLVEPNPKEISKAMKYLWDDERIVKMLGKNAQKTMIDKCHPDIILPKYIKIYKSILNEI